MARDDQLAVIFDVLGTPNDEDISYVTDAKALGYLRSFTNIPRMDMATKYPGASGDGTDLLNRMLQFNPYFRISVDEALAHPFFTRVRKPHKERESSLQVVLDFEAETLDRTRLRQLFVEIICDFEREKDAKAAAAGTQPTTQAASTQ